MAQVNISSTGIDITVIDDMQGSRDAERAALRLIKAVTNAARPSRDDKPTEITALKPGFITLIEGPKFVDERHEPIGFTIADE